MILVFILLGCLLYLWLPDTEKLEQKIEDLEIKIKKIEDELQQRV